MAKLIDNWPYSLQRALMIDRRRFVQCLAVTGIGTTTLHRAIAQRVQDEQGTDKPIEVTEEMIKSAEWIAGSELSDEQRAALARAANASAKSMDEMRQLTINASTLPAVHFFPLADSTQQKSVDRNVHMTESAPPQLPETGEELAFLPVTELAALIQTRQVSSMELTQLYLKRLKKYDPVLRCVVNLTEDLALDQAAKADAEISAGRYRGPLHGIPWGAKDLMAVPSYPTTWGIPQFKDRVLDEMATVAQRLQECRCRAGCQTLVGCDCHGR